QQQWQQQLGQWSRGELALQPLAESWSKIEMSDVTSWLYLVLSDCLKARMGVPAAQQTLAGDVQPLCDCATLDPAKLLTLQAQVQAVLGQLLSGLGNYNKQLLCESLLLHWPALIQNGPSPSGIIWVVAHYIGINPPAPARTGVLSLTIKDNSVLYAPYVPFIKEGGWFLPPSKQYQMGADVSMLLK